MSQIVSIGLSNLWSDNINLVMIIFRGIMHIVLLNYDGRLYSFAKLFLRSLDSKRT